MSVPGLQPLPDISVQTGTLRDGAEAMRTESRLADERYDEARDSWRKLREAYRHEGTQETVWAGLDLIEDPLGQWRSALSTAAQATETFADQVDTMLLTWTLLFSRIVPLELQRSAAIASNDPVEIAAATVAVNDYNTDVDELDREWTQAQTDLETALDAIVGGENDELPDSHEPVEVCRDWEGLKHDVGVATRKDDPAWITAEVQAMTTADAMHLDAMRFQVWVKTHPSEVREFLGSNDYIQWLDKNPDVAKTLVQNKLPDNPRKGSPEAAMAKFVDNPENFDPGSNRSHVAAVREQWDTLAPEDQAYLLLTYPNVFGNMNGVPMEQRAQTGALNVRGHLALVDDKIEAREKLTTWEERIPGYSEIDGGDWAHPKAYNPGYDDLEARTAAEDAWLLEGVELRQNQEGLTAAWQQYQSTSRSQDMGQPTSMYRTVFVDPTGNGQIVTMQGELYGNTRHINTFTPGTYTTMASTGDYNEALASMTGGSHDDTVNFYWADTEFPGQQDPRTGRNIGETVVTDNMTSRWSEAGAPRLAAFDQAVDLENGTATQTTIAHSAGAPLAGTAEQKDNGMTTDKFLYLAPAGSGHNVGSPEDTVNPDADRAVVQTREDMIRGSQIFGGSFHGPGPFRGADPTTHMNAVRLETGYTGDSSPQRPVRVGDRANGGHSALWEPNSTSRANIEAFIYGQDLVPELPNTVDSSTHPHRPHVLDGLEANPHITTHHGFDEFKRPYDEVIR